MKLKSYLRGIGVGILVTAAVFLVAGRNDKDASMTDAQIIARAKELGMVEATTLADVAKQKDSTEVAANSDKIEETKETSDSDSAGEKPDTNSEKENAKTDKAETEVTPEAKKEEPKVTPETKKEESKATPEAKKEEPKVTPEAKKEEQKVTPEAKKEEAKVTPEAKKEEAKATPAAGANDAKATPAAGANDAKAAPAAGANDAADIIVIVVNSGDGSDTVAKKFFDAGLVSNAHEFDLFLMEKGYDRKITVGNHKIKKNATREEMGLNLVSATK